MAFSKIERRLKIKRRIRRNIFGTAEKPRMSVYRSNRQISVQIIDDLAANTLVSATSKCKEIEGVKATKSEKAAMVGKMVAKIALEKGIKEVVFDRGGFIYQGKVKALAEAAREAGLEF